MARPARSHYLHRNEVTRSPHHVAFFDTEFPADPARKGEGQPFRCACIYHWWRHGLGPKAEPEGHLWTVSRTELADWVEHQARGNHALWLWAHNAAVDLQASGLLEILLERGWEFGREGVSNPGLWCHLTKGRHVLRICDLFTWLPTSEQRMGELMELPKTRMPAAGADLADWYSYCWRDVEIGVEALRRLLAWWDVEALGVWTDTGTGCGWNALRHMIGDSHVWIEQEPAARAFERSAIYSGRRDVYRVGDLGAHELVDLDLERAFTSVVEHFRLPAGRGRRFAELAMDSDWLDVATVGVIAECRLRTPSPRYPLRTSRGVIHPVGDFVTTLASPEIVEARRRGELLSIGAGIAYRLTPWAQPYARWLNQLLEQPEGQVDPIVRLMLKQWSRAVWGRTASRVGGRTEWSEGPDARLTIEQTRDPSTMDRVTIMSWNYRTRWTWQDQDADDSFPAVLAFIQSHVRVLVGRLVDAIGEDAVVQIASDGVLVEPWRLAELLSEAGVSFADLETTFDVGRAAADLLSAAVGPLQVQLKDVLRRVQLKSADHLDSDGVRRISGVGRAWERVGDWIYEGITFPSLAHLTRLGPAGEVHVMNRKVNLQRVRPLRWVYEDGCCGPLWAWVRPDGSTAVATPPQGLTCPHGAALAAWQHPALMLLLGRGEQVEAKRRGAAMVVKRVSPPAATVSGGVLRERLRG
jgi:hypothetical protein